MHTSNENSASLARLRVVLMETSHPGNIGAAARAMKVMGLRQLYLVRPQQFPHAEATARASGADELLSQAVLCNSIDEALAGCSLVFGVSARLRSLSWPLVDARQAAQQAAVAALGGQEVALVFGREQSGLSNEELQRCNCLLHIPTNPDYSSLNLAAAVQVVSYELRMALLDSSALFADEGDYASADELESFYAHLEQTLIKIGFLDPDNPRQVLRRLRRLYNRAHTERVELNILRGILTETQKSCR
ncbi:MAG: tRNA (cytosine(32)/uridine(32)-2'-O)-methyltransferase TrmJ [Thiohalomonadaceae bacterium]